MQRRSNTESRNMFSRTRQNDVKKTFGDRLTTVYAIGLLIMINSFNFIHDCFGRHIKSQDHETHTADASIGLKPFSNSPLLEERRSDSRVGRHHERHLAGHSRRVSRRYWGDELSACIEIHCMALSNNEDTIDQYVACLMVNCPEAIVQMPTVDQQLPVLLSSDD